MGWYFPKIAILHRQTKGRLGFLKTTFVSAD
jgi:hypothetical protein